jgi:threonine dehydratase
MIDELERRISEAHAERAPDVRTTPLLRSPGLSRALGCELFLKCEHHQTTGSFKYRGAANKLRMLGKSGLGHGVVTASSGNHGQAVALAGRNAAIPVTVYVAASASPAKMVAITGYGAELVVLEADALAVEMEARRIADEEGKPFISPYNDLDVIAGQGTIGVELLDQLEDFDAVFASVGGGGLISGVGAAIKARRPEVGIVGCWPENSPALHEALERGAIVDVPERDTLSDGTAGGIEAGSVTFDLCRRFIDAKVLVGEAAIASAMREIAAHERWIVEGAAGVALAGLVALAERYRGKRIVAILCGRNIALEKFLKAIG